MNLFALLAQFLIKHPFHHLTFDVLQITFRALDAGQLLFAWNLKLLRFCLNFTVRKIFVMRKIFFFLFYRSVLSYALFLASRRSLNPGLLYTLDHVVLVLWCLFLGYLWLTLLPLFVVNDDHLVLDSEFRWLIAFPWEWMCEELKIFELVRWV